MDDSEQVLTIANHDIEELIFLGDETAEIIENRMDDVEVDVPAVHENNLIEVNNAEVTMVKEGLIIVLEDNIISEKKDFVKDKEEI